MLKSATIISTLIFTACIAAAPAAQAWHLEVGQATTNNTATTPSFRNITFTDSFDVAPIVIVLTRNENAEPALVRIRNVSTTGFQIAPIEPHNEDGIGPAMTVDYIAIEPGIYTLADGTIIAAGNHTTSTVQAHSSLGLTTGWDTVSFGTTFSANATVLAGTQTFNSETASVPAASSDPFISVAMRNPNASSVQMALERAESDGGAVSAETIGWLALQSGTSGSFNDTSSNIISWDARNTSNSIVGWNNPCVTSTYTSTAWANARVIASQLSRNGNNGGWIRRCSISSTQIGLQIDEDQSNDNERAHIAEIAGLLAFSDSFHAEFNGEISADKSVSLIEDPINGSSDAYVLPGARMRYSIEAQSLGNSPIDNDSVVIADKIPDNVALVVDDIDGPLSGPVRFTDGPVSSNLTYSFTSLSDLSDDVEFSSDNGATYSYIPIASGDGTDGNVTHIRITPKGAFENATGSDYPSFTLKFDTIVQ